MNVSLLPYEPSNMKAKTFLLDLMPEHVDELTEIKLEFNIESFTEIRGSVEPV